MYRKYVNAILISICCLLTLCAYAQDGQLDMTFNPNDAGNGLGDGPNYEVYAVKQQADGKILVAGLFNYYNGGFHDHLVRVNTDGSLDNTFNTSISFNGPIYGMALQQDGKIVVGGYFTSHGSISTNYIARLNTDGTLDTTFAIGTGFNDVVYSVCIQPDGKILSGGYFGAYQGVTAHTIARLNTDGSRDTSFNSGGAGPNGPVRNIKMTSGGDIFVGGYFSAYNGYGTLAAIAKLNPSGVPDLSFSPGNSTVGGVADFDIQPDGKVVIGGSFSSIQGHGVQNIARLMPNGSLDLSFDTQSGFDSMVVTLKVMPGGFIAAAGYFSNYQGLPAQGGICILDSSANQSSVLAIYDDHTPGYGYALGVQADGKLLYGGDYECNGRRNLLRFNADYSNDETFNKGNSFDFDVNDVELEPDGKLIAGGSFISYYDVSARMVARLNGDGSIDNTFQSKIGPNNLNGQYTDYIDAVAAQPDGKVLVGGGFAAYDSLTSQRYLVRLNADGTLDTSFHRSVFTNNVFYTISVMTDGRILVGGNFFANGHARYFTRLLPDGTVDSTFHYNTISNDVIYHKMLSDGRIYICGDFTVVSTGIHPAHRIARLLADGTQDTTFVSKIGADGTVNSLDVQADGKIIIGGNFAHYDSVPTYGIARLNTDGSLDTSFHTSGGTDSSAVVVKTLSSGKVIVGGTFLKYGGQTAIRLMRLNADGSLDQTFSAGSGPNRLVQDIEVQPDGKAIVVGLFTNYNGTGRNRIARIEGVAPSAINEITMIDGVNLYPNPSRGTFTIDAGDKSIEQIHIYDLSGKELKRELPGRSRLTINSSIFTPGMYLVTIKTSEGTVSKKLIVE